MGSLLPLLPHVHCERQYHVRTTTLRLQHYVSVLRCRDKNSPWLCDIFLQYPEQYSKPHLCWGACLQVLTFCIPIPIGETQKSYICYIRDPNCCYRYSAYPSTCGDAGPGEAINPKAGWKISKYLWDVRKRESPLINVLSVGLFVHNSKCTHNTHSLVSRPKQPQHGSLPVSLARKEGLGIWPGITRIFGMSTIYLLVTSFSLNFILKKSSPRGNC